MRIVFIVQHFPPSIGGIQMRAYRISKGLSLRGHEVTVFTAAYPRAPRIQQEGNLRIKRYDLLHPAVARFIEPPYFIIPELMKLLTNREEIQEADVIQTFHFLSHASFMGSCLKFLRKKPFALSPIFQHPQVFMQTFNYVYEIRRLKSLISKWYLFSSYLTLGIRVIKSADFLEPMTHLEKKWLEECGANPDKIEVIPGSIDVESYKELPAPSDFRKECSIEQDEKLILFVGHSCTWKGAHHIMLAMKEIVKKIHKAKLVIIGPFQKKAYWLLSNFGSPLIKNRTLILPPRLGKALIEAYSAADVFVLPSAGEGFGAVYLEAAASGLPIISTKTGVALDIIQHGKNGLFAEYGNVSQLSDAIIQILSDENFKKQAMKKRRFILEIYNVDREIESYEKAYNRIVTHLH